MTNQPEKLSCLGCKGKLSQEVSDNIRQDVYDKGGDPSGVKIRACSDCPPGAIAEYEYQKLLADDDRFGFSDYRVPRKKKKEDGGTMSASEDDSDD